MKMIVTFPVPITKVTGSNSIEIEVSGQGEQVFSDEFGKSLVKDLGLHTASTFLEGMGVEVNRRLLMLNTRAQVVPGSNDEVSVADQVRRDWQKGAKGA